MSNNIVMAFSLRIIVGCLLKKGVQRGGGGSKAPQDPLATPLKNHEIQRQLTIFLLFHNSNQSSYEQLVNAKDLL